MEAFAVESVQPSRAFPPKKLIKKSCGPIFVFGMVSCPFGSFFAPGQSHRWFSPARIFQVMADQSSSSTTEAQVASSSVVPKSNAIYDEEKVQALRKQGIEAELADKWEDAAEYYSKALELWYVEISPGSLKPVVRNFAIPATWVFAFLSPFFRHHPFLWIARSTLF